MNHPKTTSTVFFLFFLLMHNLVNSQNSYSAIDYSKADSIAISLRGENLDNLPMLCYRLTEHLDTEKERFRAIYRWVCDNVENDYYSYLKVSKKRKKLKNYPLTYDEWNKEYVQTTFKTLRNTKATTCTGYAYLIREMSFLAGIECKIIDGFSDKEKVKNGITNHSWNAVNLEDKWYLCDATWSAGKTIIDKEGPYFKKYFEESYFLAEPETFFLKHIPLNPEWTLISSIPKNQLN
ncbi:transglutaminase domain-containing protein [Euzebyella saccharophila]|uniref:Transglutaminase domain-containing protein n=1 Tax=Euzebyella saccharophila TaxID=679664 RepID=A0ABV8JJP5_9FLAO|nr:transglutaminase-like domain-containing protein [Euzebyella saccharophila]